MFAILAQEHNGLRRLGHPCGTHTQCSLDFTLLDQLQALSVVAIIDLHWGHRLAVPLQELDGKPPGCDNVHIRLHMVLVMLGPGRHRHRLD